MSQTLKENSVNVKSMYRDQFITLLLCPFCGGEPKMINIGNNLSKRIRVEIKCTKCRAYKVNAALQGHSMDWLEDVSAEDWNMRQTT